MTATVPDFTPVAAHERIQALDVVRGFAIPGIFLMNLEYFARPMADINLPGIDPTMAGVDYVVDALVFFFVQSKFWTLFALLFGMGFAVMIERARQAGRPFVPAYLRRSLALLGIGAAHALLVWSGDILVTYAIGALLLLAARGVYRAMAGAAAGEPPEPVKPAVLAGIGALLYALPLAVLLGFGVLGSLLPVSDAPSPEQGQALEAMAQARDAAEVAYRDGSYADTVHQRVLDMAHTLEPGNLMFFLALLLGVYLIGMAILRAGIVADPRAHAGLLRRTRNIGLPVGFAVMGVSTLLGTGMNFDSFGLRDAVQLSTYLSAGLILALAYGATVVLMLDGPAGGWMQRWLAPAGRMALTNYLAQSLFGTLLFYGYGLGMWGRLGRAEAIGFALVFFALQLVLSRAWLATFRFGPVEWLWRALTYLQLPPMRQQSNS